MLVLKLSGNKAFLFYMGIYCILGYANFGYNENFHLLHFAVPQTNDREIE